MSAVKQVIAINENDRAEVKPVGSETVRPSRRRLPDERRAITHHFPIAGHEGYLTVGVYDDGSPGEIFVRMAKEGSTISGLMDSIATVVSLALQHGVPLDVLCSKFSHTRFEPSGWSGNPKIGFATSLMDYLFRWMELKFLKNEQGELFGPLPASIASVQPASEKGAVEALGEFVQFGDAPACNTCGSLMVRSGTCYRCMTCGSTSGCS